MIAELVISAVGSAVLTVLVILWLVKTLKPKPAPRRWQPERLTREECIELANAIGVAGSAPKLYAYANAAIRMSEAKSRMVEGGLSVSSGNLIREERVRAVMDRPLEPSD